MYRTTRASSSDAVGFSGHDYKRFPGWHIPPIPIGLTMLLPAQSASIYRRYVSSSRYIWTRPNPMVLLQSLAERYIFLHLYRRLPYNVPDRCATWFPEGGRCIDIRLYFPILGKHYHHARTKHHLSV